MGSINSLFSNQPRKSPKKTSSMGMLLATVVLVLLMNGGYAEDIRGDTLGCEYPFIAVGGMAGCYFFSGDLASHPLSKAKCEELGARLLTLEEPSDNGAIQMHMKSHGIHWSWIDLTLRGDTWLWADTTEVTYDGWHAGEP